jgi:hypothetical protein
MFMGNVRSIHNKWGQTSSHAEIKREMMSALYIILDVRFSFCRRDNCYRCVVFHEKHLNVLQYKESK